MPSTAAGPVISYHSNPFYDFEMQHSKSINLKIVKGQKTRSSWLNCALRVDEAVYWVSIGHYEAVAVGN